jgi:phosphomannomutase / phosphoglucomutase
VNVFKAYDIRGLYGLELTEDLAKRVGKAFGSYAQGNIALGRDTRISGPSLQKAFLEGILSTGCQVHSYGVVTIPIMSFMTKTSGFRAAAYISASHNPPEYNGIRFRTGDGYGLLYHDTEIMTFFNQGDFTIGTGKLIDCSTGEAIRRYGNYVAKRLDLNRNLKIVLDMGNGSACTMRSLYDYFGFHSIILNGSMDGNFSGRGPAPTEESLFSASSAVVEETADLGVGFDPDADRGIIIDDKGRVLPPEKVAIILARKRYEPGDVVISGFDCSMILEKELEPDGIRVMRERVGDVFVANRVKNSGAVLGVERSGHFFLPEFQYSDDPFAMTLALGEIISNGEKLSELADQIPVFPYIQKSIRIDENPASVMLKLKDILAKFEPDTTDGLKILTESYSVLIRPSNTEPLIRLYIETTANDLKDLTDRFEKIIRSALSI